MLTHNQNTELALVDSFSAPTTELDLQKAWHLLSLLLSAGQLISPHKLASRCTLFPATSDFVRFLCSIPNSPLALTGSNTEGVLVTISVLGLLAFRRFASNFNSIDALFTPIGTSRVHSSGMLLKNAVRVYFRKRKRIGIDSLEVDDKKVLSVSSCAKRFRNDPEVNFQMIEHTSRRIYAQPNFMSIKLHNIIMPPNFSAMRIINESIQLKNAYRVEDEAAESIVVAGKESRRIMVQELDEESVCPRVISDSEPVFQYAKVDEVDLDSRMNADAISCKDDFKQQNMVPELYANDGLACNAENDCYIHVVGGKCLEKDFVPDSGSRESERESLIQPTDARLFSISKKRRRKNEQTSVDKERITTHTKSLTIIKSSQLESVSQKQLSKPSIKMKLTYADAMGPRNQAVNQSLEGNKAAASFKEKHHVKKNLTTMKMGQKAKQKHEHTHTKEGKKDYATYCHTDQVQTKDLPCFESYVVEEEEGSGGYGTVYRARRKSDGTTVAIKCPHENAHRHHVSNELRMLERFGGKNFVIKYEGSFKNGNSDCLVLEHVEHDRPEVLKKDINLLQLRWYGYCMFRALASLHRQGVVHRDVKPGNFLFSRNSSKGYLIDFNLSMDLRQKHGTANKLKAGNELGINPVMLPNSKSAPPTKSRRFLVARSAGSGNREVTEGLKPTLELKNQSRGAVNRPKVENGRNIMRSQGAEGSGVTSTKDVTSTRTPSAERLREPLPCQGRKELISLLQEAVHHPNLSSVPASVRKRIPAPPGKVDEKHFYLTPMPLNSTGVSIPGKYLGKNKDAKPKKEGPCVGTKGFRAPEVLFRSTHQGPKVDIWSAGVTLLYLMIGRTPFHGDPEQNIKEIAKLRGSEDLWEVAKLHDRESAFPLELYNTDSLPSMTLWEWWKINTKRDFLDIIPSSLIDLVDKCLTVNPRLRISAEEALKHEFFAPCHEDLRKQRIIRQGHSLDSGTKLPYVNKALGMKCL